MADRFLYTGGEKVALPPLAQPEPVPRMSREEALDFFDQAAEFETEWSNPVHSQSKRNHEQTWYENFSRGWSGRDFNSFEDYVDWATNLKDPNTNMPLVNDANIGFVKKKLREHMPGHIQEQEKVATAKREAIKMRKTQINLAMEEAAMLKEGVSTGQLPPPAAGTVWKFDKNGRLFEDKLAVDRNAIKDKRDLQERLDEIDDVLSSRGTVYTSFGQVPNKVGQMKLDAIPKLSTKKGVGLEKPKEIPGRAVGRDKLLAERERLAALLNEEEAVEMEAEEPVDAPSQYQEGNRAKLLDGRTAIFVNGNWMVK